MFRWSVPIVVVTVVVVTALIASSPSVAGPAPVILEGRIVHLEPAAAGERPVLIFEVDEILNGFVPGSSLHIRVTPGEHPFLDPHLQPGKTLRLDLEPRGDGDYELRGGYLLRERSFPESETPLPGGLAIAPETLTPVARPSRDGLSSVSAAAAPAPTFEQTVMEIVNQRRLENGNLPPLKKDALLDASSELHSSNMASRDFFAHCDPDTGTLPWDRMDDAGYFWSNAGENIAAGYGTPNEVMAGWMGSSGHRANILSTTFREIGIGYVLQSTDAGGVRFDQNGNCVPDSSGGPYFRYWTQNFGARFNVYPVVVEREDHVTEDSSVNLYVYGAGWAQDMRFSNDQSTWSGWQAFSSSKTWSLSGGSGLKTVYAELRNGGIVRQASDTIWLDSACTLQVNSLDLTNQTAGGTQTFEACDQITAHQNFHVSGNITFRAGQTIVLGDGFSVGSNASFQAVLQTP